MQVAIVGGGISGRAIESAVLAKGHSTALLSRSNGFDVRKDDAVERLRDFDVIVEATGLFTLSEKTATDFFTASTRALGRAALASGARHILLSIVNCEKPALQGYGYFAGKAAQERAARHVNPGVTIIRSTQWFEFAQQNLDRFTFGPLALILGMNIQPVALDAVALAMAECIAGERPGQSFDFCGPEPTTLWKMTAAIREGQNLALPLFLPGATWKAFRTEGLLPGPGVEPIGPRFSDWTAAHGNDET